MKPELETIPGFPGYFADRNGNIYSSRGRWNKNKKIRMLSKSKVGHSPRFYLASRIYDASMNTHLYSNHSLVLTTFVGPRPKGLYACHGENGRLDNSLKNIYWGTPSRNNKKDRIRDGTHLFGETHPRHKLMTEQVIAIRKLFAEGMNRFDLAKQFKVSSVHIWAIVHRKLWKHI